MGRAVWLAAVLTGAGGLAPRAAAVDLGAIRVRAEQGDPAALTTLGAAYADGRDLPTDYPRALAYFRQAAAAGSAPAEYNLGLMCEAGRGTPPDLAAAFGHYQRAAAWQGLAPAEFNVGNMYASGRGVAPDPFEAVFWLRQAALKNLPEAEYNLALAYEFGRGIPKDEAQALHWYRAASAQGYAPAQYNLALMLADGRGTPVDLVAAAGLLRQAGMQGFVAAQNDYGVALAAGRGFGGPALGPAYAWLSLAVENGMAPHNRDLVGRKLSAAQRMEAAIQLGELHAEAGRPRAVWEGTAGRGGGVMGADAPSAGTLALAAEEPRAAVRPDPESRRAGNTGALGPLAGTRPDALLDPGLFPVAGLHTSLFASSDTGAIRAAQARIDELQSSLAAARSELAGAQRMADASGRLAAEQADAREALAKERAAFAQRVGDEAQAAAEREKALAAANDKLQAKAGDGQGQRGTRGAVGRVADGARAPCGAAAADRDPEGREPAAGRTALAAGLGGGPGPRGGEGSGDGARGLAGGPGRVGGKGQVGGCGGRRPRGGGEPGQCRPGGADRDVEGREHPPRSAGAAGGIGDASDRDRAKGCGAGAGRAGRCAGPADDPREDCGGQ